MLELMKKIIFTLLMLTFINCQKENEVDVISSTDIDLITGIEMTNIYGVKEYRIGNPNVLSNGLLIYPNPIKGIIGIMSLEGVKITDFWILKGYPKKLFQDIDFDKVLSSDLYTENELNNKALKRKSDLENYNIYINLEDFETGHYRVFIKVDGKIKWDNFYILNEKESPLDLLDNFWK